MTDNIPKITIITVCYNAASSIQKTMESVLYQNYPAIEYIIVDGASNDGTLEIIEKLKTSFVEKGIDIRCFSEKDKGIYDAMNKGISFASGKWINFMNSGDCFYSPDILMKVFESNPEETLLYGDTVFQMSFGNILLKPKPVNMLEKKMAFCHQSVFMPTRVMKAYPFSLKYRIAGDFNFFHNYYKRGGTFSYLGFTISYFESEDGISSTNSLLAHKENAMIRFGKLTPLWHIKFKLKSGSYHFKEGLKKIFPQPLVEGIRSKLYRRQMRRRMNKQNSEMLNQG